MRMRDTSRRTWCGLSLNSSTWGSRTRSAQLPRIGSCMVSARMRTGPSSPTRQRNGMRLARRKSKRLKPELEGVEAEHIHDFRVEVGLLGRQQIAPQWRLEPVRRQRVVHQVRHRRTPPVNAVPRPSPAMIAAARRFGGRRWRSGPRARGSCLRVLDIRGFSVHSAATLWGKTCCSVAGRCVATGSATVRTDGERSPEGPRACASTHRGACFLHARARCAKALTILSRF